MKPRDAVLPANINVIELPGRSGPYYYGSADFLFASRVLGRYPAHDPFWKDFDVIHINQCLGLPFTRLTDSSVPILSLIHHPASVDRRIAIRESHGLGRLQWSARYASLVFMQKKLTQKFPHIATVSRASAEDIARDYEIPPEKISIIPNGIDGSLFASAVDETPEFDAIAIGSFVHPRKGFPYMLETYRKLAEKGCRIADVGRRTEEQLHALKKIAGVKVYGSVPHEVLTMVLRKSSVLLSTALYEGFGLTLIEALAMGRPAFAFEGGGVREVLDPIDPSLVVASRRSDLLVDRVMQFLALPDVERRSKGSQYRTRVLDLYGIEKSASALKNVYEKIIHKP